MTTPLPVMPKAYVFRVKAPTEGNPQNLAPERLEIGPGVHTIQVTWSQNRRLQVGWAKTLAWEDRIILADFPAAVGRRSAVISGLGVPAGGRRWLSINTPGTSATQAEADAGAAASVVIITTPLAGG